VSEKITSLFAQRTKTIGKHCLQKLGLSTSLDSSCGAIFAVIVHKKMCIGEKAAKGTLKKLRRENLHIVIVSHIQTQWYGHGLTSNL
jgi:hypothetical protein